MTYGCVLLYYIIGGLVTSFLDNISRHVLEFDEKKSHGPTAGESHYQYLLLEDSDEYGLTAFVPSPVSISIIWGGDGDGAILEPSPREFGPLHEILRHNIDDDDDKSAQELRTRMRRFGAIVGIALNTLPCAMSVSLGVPLDKVVFVRLMNPRAKLQHEEVLESAVCQKASSVREHLLDMIEDEEDYKHFPKLKIDKDGDGDGIGDNQFNVSAPENNGVELEFWERYCTHLVDHMLDTKRSPAFKWMLEGFEMASHRNQRRYVNRPDLAHRLLVGHNHRLTFETLKSRLRFEPSETVFVETFGESKTSLNEAQNNALKALQRLSDEERSLLVKAITGSRRLRKSKSSMPIIIRWFKGTRAMDEASPSPSSRPHHRRYTMSSAMAHTCTNELKIAFPSHIKNDGIDGVEYFLSVFASFILSSSKDNNVSHAKDDVFDMT